MPEDVDVLIIKLTRQIFLLARLSSENRTREPDVHSLVSVLQIKGAEEFKFLFRCDVWFEQQCRAEAL